MRERSSLRRGQGKKERGRERGVGIMITLIQYMCILLILRLVEACFDTLDEVQTYITNTDDIILS